NVLMTAAHCGYNDYAGNLPDKVATFKVARGGGWSDSESFLCHKVFTTWGGGSVGGPYDLMALYCDPNARGENPGDKYGYLDFDPSTPTVGESIYSLWANSLDSTAEQDARIYSLGTVAAVGSASAKATLNMWGQPGASGSPHLNVANSRVLIG